MATKKPAPKKTTTARKATTAKKTSTTKKATTSKRRPTVRRAAAKPKKPAVRSFRCSAETDPFMTLKITKQTIYWLIIAVAAIAFTLWIMKLQGDINDLYDQIETIRASEVTVPVVTEKPAN